MTNDSPYPVLVVAGALVAHACLIEDGQTPSFAEQELLTHDQNSNWSCVVSLSSERPAVSFPAAR